ncbi:MULTISPECIES: ferritin-like domain-containing protein [unclassified Arthrobacter]|uniref:ferritin-like domain-containing protein n=1 Tax=unclassified Arthrobacter TaxID=235627 RepID=UPI0011B047C2|nr:MULTISPECIES: ferritin-like domain-containing protein [unclassified Arthrobacter]
MQFTSWLAYFEANSRLHDTMNAHLNWSGVPALTENARRGFIRSFQRLELGESGEGRHLLGLAERAGDSTYVRALELLVREEQQHSRLFGQALDYLDAPRLESHWSDKAFTLLRRMLGLRTELGLFLIAESVAMGYFEALASHAPDATLRGLGRRIASDERNHLRFQIDRLRQGFEFTPKPLKHVVRGIWSVVAAGAAVVVCFDHAQALRACSLNPAHYWFRAMRRFNEVARQVFSGTAPTALGPLPPTNIA